MQKLTREKINLSAMKYRATPFKSFGRLREMGPVVPARLPLIGKVWLITTYDAVDECLKNDRLFCRDARNAGKRNFLIFRLAIPMLFRKLTQNMIGKDEPDHRRLRSLVDQAFQRQNIADMRPRIHEIVDGQLDEIEKLAITCGGAIDLIEHLARPVPLTVICELLGLPPEDRSQFKQWFSSFANINSVWNIFRVVPGLRKSMKYLRGQIEHARHHPRDGLITALVEAEHSGDQLSDDELESMVMLLLLAGHETTVHLLSTSILTLLTLPHAKKALQSDWSKVDLAVEELLRYNSPAQFAKPRFVTEDTDFHGQHLKRGDMVMPVLAAANYDPRRFDRPTEFILDRKQNYHLDFGAGPHVCLGLKLARAETQIVLERLFTRWPDLQTAFDPAKPDWSGRIGMRSLKSLLVQGGSLTRSTTSNPNS